MEAIAAAAMQRTPVALVLGSISRDLDLAMPDAPARPGGTVLYAALALARLGVTTRVVTRLAPADHDLLVPLQAAGVAVHALPSTATTTYANDYRAPLDRHELRAVSDGLTADDVPPAWGEADVVQLGPLHHDDLAPGIVSTSRALRGLDLQGLVRARAGSGEPPIAHALAAHLAAVDVVQASAAELPDASPSDFRRRHGIRELVVTRGAQGATILTAGGTTHVPAVSGVEARVPVGAGDVFLALYLLARAMGVPVAAAGAVAARGAAAHVADGVLPAVLAGLPPWHVRAT